MIDLGSLFSGINAADRIAGRILSKKGTRLEKKIRAVGDLQKAINATEAYLVSSKQAYLPNADLSSLWVQAFTSMIPFDKELAKTLRNQSRFWSNPESWRREPGAMELIPKMRELDDRCEEMINTLEIRISRR